MRAIDLIKELVSFGDGSRAHGEGMGGNERVRGLLKRSYYHRGGQDGAYTNLLS